jgi:hypothetical protein
VVRSVSSIALSPIGDIEIYVSPCPTLSVHKAVCINDFSRTARVPTAIAACVKDRIRVDKDNRSARRDGVAGVTPGPKLGARCHHTAIVVGTVVTADDFKICGKRSPRNARFTTAEFGGRREIFGGIDGLVNLVAIRVHADDVPSVCQALNRVLSSLGQGSQSCKE